MRGCRGWRAGIGLLRPDNRRRTQRAAARGDDTGEAESDKP
jgi:hypothetical protein